MTFKTLYRLILAFILMVILVVLFIPAVIGLIISQYYEKLLYWIDNKTTEWLVE